MTATPQTFLKFLAGAAIAAAIRTAQQLPESFVIKKTGIGAGKRTYDRPSLLRAMLIESAEKSPPAVPMCPLFSGRGKPLPYRAHQIKASAFRKDFLSCLYFQSDGS